LRVTVIATGFKEADRKQVARSIARKPTVPTASFQAPLIPEPPESAPEDTNQGFYLGPRPNSANIAGYINESSLPSMMNDPESEDDLLDVPAFQRPKFTERR
ncbi:MAG: hypothetical protein GY765_26840, partial [bacterium]|nr:hypothetical protein [bacterium]